MPSPSIKTKTKGLLSWGDALSAPSYRPERSNLTIRALIKRPSFWSSFSRSWT